MHIGAFGKLDPQLGPEGPVLEGELAVGLNTPPRRPVQSAKATTYCESTVKVRDSRSDSLATQITAI